jgi:hypothetical protein
MRLLSSNGELVRGRCRSTNLCAYCARLGAVENSELLALDALHGEAPRFWAVLTTSRSDVASEPFYRAREAVTKALRRRWPGAEVACLVEFTTGYGPRSGGARRPHWNLLVKGVHERGGQSADELVAELREVVVSTWCGRAEVAARPRGQHVGTVKDAGGLMRYIALHFQKESQAPPAGWRGHRFLKTRGYLWRPTPEAREQARESLRYKRELWRQTRRVAAGEVGSVHDAELVARQACEIAAAATWRLLWVDPATVDTQPPLRDVPGTCARCAGLDHACAIHAPRVSASLAHGRRKSCLIWPRPRHAEQSSVWDAGSSPRGRPPLTV